MQTFADLNREIFNQSNRSDYLKKYKKGLSEKLVIQISKSKNEPEWMLKHRLKSLEAFYEIKLPDWGPKIDLDFEEITYYANATDQKGKFDSWEDIPEDIKNTFEKLGIPAAEKKMLAGVGSQYESETVYHNLKKEWEELGVVFEDMDVALQKHHS